MARVSKARKNTTLYLTDIPSEDNTTINLCNYFCKFGHLLGIVSPYKGDQSAASVTFSTSKEAKAALNSSEPLLNNRFIKMSLMSSEPATTTESTPESASASNDGPSNDSKCNLCNKVFASNWHLNFHTKRMHNGGTSIKCNMCSETFASNNMYKKHIRAEHLNACVQENVDRKTPVTNEYASNNISNKWMQKRTEKIAVLRIKNKSLKKMIKGHSKAYSKALKIMDKLKKNHEIQLKGELIVVLS